MSRSEAACNSAENRGAHALHVRTWFRFVGTLASGKKFTLRRRSNYSFLHVALYACPGSRMFMIEIAISCDMSQYLEYK
jgi:hypothetical protein